MSATSLKGTILYPASSSCRIMAADSNWLVLQPSVVIATRFIEGSWFKVLGSRFKVLGSRFLGTARNCLCPTCVVESRVRCEGAGVKGKTVNSEY